MGRVHEALQKAEKEFHDKSRQTAIETKRKPDRFKIVYIGLLALAPLLLIVVAYLFFQGRHTAVAFDFEDLRIAQMRIVELQEKLKGFQSDHLILKSENESNKLEIEDLKTQVLNLEKEKALAKATSPIILQNNAEPGDAEPKEDTKSPDPNAIIDWLIEKHAK